MAHPLHAIVYVSSAVEPLTPAQIEHLLERARERNARAGVTGLLLYGDGSFMQYIEGPPEGLQPIYDIILADPLHRQINELLNEPIAEREFADWAMAYDSVTTPGFLKQLRADATSIGRARQMLRDVWGAYGRLV
jgi:hypothetical protein